MVIWLFESKAVGTVNVKFGLKQSSARNTIPNFEKRKNQEGNKDRKEGGKEEGRKGGRKEGWRDGKQGSVFERGH